MKNQNCAAQSSPLLLFLVIVPALVISITVAIGASKDIHVQGTCNPFGLLFEYFDEVTPPALPPGWSSTTWVTSNSGLPSPPADSPPNAAFVDDPANISDKQLLSPTVFLLQGGEPLQILFRNNFDLQSGFDGGVLEISFDSGLTFQDILAAGGTFLRGGYNGTISTCCGNPLAGRQAWTGNSGGFIDTGVTLPPGGTSMILRWRMGSDNSTAGQGWRVDSVAIIQCLKPPPTPNPRAWTPRPRPTPAPRP